MAMTDETLLHPGRETVGSEHTPTTHTATTMTVTQKTSPRVRTARGRMLAKMLVHTLVWVSLAGSADAASCSDFTETLFSPFFRTERGRSRKLTNGVDHPQSSSVFV